jgi:hypothetical protein
MATPINDNIYKNIVSNNFMNSTKNASVNKLPSNANLTTNLNNLASNANLPSSNLNKLPSNANLPSSNANLPSSNANLPSSNANLPSSNANLPSSNANLTNLNKLPSNDINNNNNNNNLPLTLKQKLNNIPIKYDPNRSTLSIFNAKVKDIGTTISSISKVFVDTGAEVATIGIKTGENAAKIEGIAAANASADLADTAANIAKTKLPGLIGNVKDVTKVITEGIGEVNNVIDNTKLEMKEALIKEQIAIMMKSQPELTEEQARMKLEEDEKLKKEEVKRETQVELEKSNIAAMAKKADALEAVAEAKILAATGGSNKGSKKRNTLKNIQKGGKMSARRSQKSIRDFLKPTITSSSILKMMRSCKKSVKKRKYNYANKALRSKRRR